MPYPLSGQLLLFQYFADCCASGDQLVRMMRTRRFRQVFCRRQRRWSIVFILYCVDNRHSLQCNSNSSTICEPSVLCVCRVYMTSKSIWLTILRLFAGARLRLAGYFVAKKSAHIQNGIS